MGEYKILKPKEPGDVVRDPVSREVLPQEGKAVKMTSFWRRRLADGSVIEIAATKSGTKAPETKGKE